MTQGKIVLKQTQSGVENSSMRYKQHIFTIGYVILLALHLYGGSFGYELLTMLTKPALLIALSFYFYFNSRELDSSFRNLMQAGLALSLAGDIFLMFSGNNYFIIGLIAFLLAHLCYIFAFLKAPGQVQVSKLINHSWLMILVLAYGFIFFMQLKSNLGVMSVPVMIYMVVIMLMLIIAISRYGRVGKLSFLLIVIGASLFVASDSILAWNRFMEPLDYAHFLVMSTYGSAQLLITLGALRQVEDFRKFYYFNTLTYK